MDATFFASRLDDHGARPAVLAGGETLTYGELSERVVALAEALGEERRLVLLACRNDVGSLVGYLAALAGGHPVLLAPADRPAALEPLVAAYDPDVVIRPGPGGPTLDERRPGTRHDLHPDLALLLSTSGSTGSPKLVRLSRENLQANALAIAESLGIRREDRAATTLPMHYCYGLSVVNSHLARGAALVLTDLSLVDRCFWDLAHRHRVTTFACVPYSFELLERVGFEDLDLPDLRYVTQAGGRLAPESVRRWTHAGQRRGWDLVVMYGQTEATARMAVLPPEDAAESPWAIGRPVPGGAFRIDPVPGLGDVPDGAPSDELVGELVYTGPNVMLGYAETPADLALGRVVSELRTGDLARRHAGGLYEVVGRLSRFVKVVGLRVDLGRVERILAEDQIAAAVAGTDRDGVVVAVEGDHDAGLIATMLTGTLGLPRTAVHVHAVEGIPRLPSGKPDYPAVLALAQSSSAAASAAPAGVGADDGEPGPGRAVAGRPPDPAPADQDAVRRIFAEQFGLADVDDGATFVSLGGDSLSYVATALRLEDALGHLPVDWHVTPIRDLRPRPVTPGRFARVMAPLESSIVLRAVAIVLVVGTHSALFGVPGMAHVLVAVAGFNFARFQLSGERRARLRRHLRSLGRVVVPSVAFIAVAYPLTDDYTLANVALLNSIVGPPTWTTQWHFWFVEVLVYVLLAVTALLAVPWLDRAQRRFPFAFPLGLLGAGLLTRFEVVDLGLVHPRPVLWLFALGWAAAASRSASHRLAISAVAAMAVPGFFDNPHREGVVLAGLLVLVWLPMLPVPGLLHRVGGLLASASLYVYLTHWIVYPALVGVHPAVAVVASLLVGVGYWALVIRLPRAMRRVRRGLRHRLPAPAGGSLLLPRAST